MGFHKPCNYSQNYCATYNSLVSLLTPLPILPNFPTIRYIDWKTMSALAYRPYAATHTSLTDLVQDRSIVQVVTQPTQFQSILDLFLLKHSIQMRFIINL